MIDQTTIELSILKQANHPFIMKLKESFNTRLRVCLVMPWFRGGDLLQEIRRKGKIEERVAKIYMVQIILAIGHLHSYDIAHRDLKPDNLLKKTDGTVKITDFGVSELFSEDADEVGADGTS